MTAPIGPGDWVECVGHGPHIGLSRGSLWLCENLQTNDFDGPCRTCGGEGVEIVLRGISPPEGYAFCPCGFRPIYRPNSNLIRLLTQPAPEREREPA